jgi:nuclear pore complex protein Nup188
VKEDALWLSQTARIDETAALRIVVLECQSRATARLLGPLSEEELASIREAAGNNQFSSPITVSLASRGKDAADIQTQFDKEDSRRQRILLTYLSERQHLLKCVERLLSALGNQPMGVSANGKKKGVPAADTWLETGGQAVASQIRPLDNFLLQGFNAIESFFQKLSTGSGWYQNDPKPVLEDEWARSQLIEATHTMEIVFQIVSFQEELSTSDVVLGWLNLLQSYGFLDGLNMVGIDVNICA